MLEQSAERTPQNILDDMSPCKLQATMQNLCKLAFDALAKKQVVFKESELKSAGCLGATAELGLLSWSPGANIAGYHEDAYSFSHHTMLEFFAAVHAVCQCIRKANTAIDDFVEAQSVDGDYSRFWLFVSGLLSGEECQSLLSALASKAVAKDLNSSDRSRLLLLFLHCHAECVAQLPPGGSSATTMLMKSTGTLLQSTYLSVSDARVTAAVLRQYNSTVEVVSLLGTSMDDIAVSIIVSGLQLCTRLKRLDLSTVSGTFDGIQGIAHVIDQNKTTLQVLDVPAGDGILPEVTPAIQKCTRLGSFKIGSRSLTNASATQVAEVVSNHPSLTELGLAGEIDDEGFVSIAPSLQYLAESLWTLILSWTRVSVSMLSSMLSSFACLRSIQLIENPIDDDDFKQLTTALEEMQLLQSLFLMNVGVTCRSVMEMEELLHAAPTLHRIIMISKKDAFLRNGEDTDHVTQLTTMEVAAKKITTEPINICGTPVTEGLVFRTNRSQEVQLMFFS